VSARVSPEAWLVTTGAVHAAGVWDEAVAGMQALRAAGLDPRLLVLAPEAEGGSTELPLDATVVESAAFEPNGDSRAVRDAIEHVSGLRGRPSVLVGVEGDRAVEGLARIAARWGVPLLPSVRSWRVTRHAIECTCEGLAGQGNERSVLDLVGTLVVTQSRLFAAQGRPLAGASAAAVERVRLPDAGCDVAALRMIDTERPIADMTTAPIVVAGGLGLGDKAAVALVAELAEALGGAVGGTRPIVDLGWLPTDRLIGATGRAIAPDLYVALGISGATQHVSSIRAGTVVSVNIDPAATMTRIADLGLVGDLHEVVPALAQAIREHRR